MQIYIIRHALSGNNVLYDREQHTPDPELTPLGWQQAERLALHLAAESSNRDGTYEPYQLSHLYTSPLRRALETTFPLMQILDCHVSIWPEIHEHGGVGAYKKGVYRNRPGLTRPQIDALCPGIDMPDSLTETGWWRYQDGFEAVEHYRRRERQVADELLAMARKTRPNTRIGLITHGGFIDGVLKAIFPDLADSKKYFRHENTGITRLDIFADGRRVMRYMNRFDHLDDELRFQRNRNRRSA